MSPNLSDRRNLLCVFAIESATLTLQALQTIDYNSVSVGFRAEMSKSLDIPVDAELLSMIISGRTLSDSRRQHLFNKLKTIAEVHKVMKKYKSDTVADCPDSPATTLSGSPSPLKKQKIVTTSITQGYGICTCDETCPAAQSDTPHGSHGFNCKKLYEQWCSEGRPPLHENQQKI